MQGNSFSHDPDALLTERQAAAFRGQSVKTLQNERVRGDGCPYVKLGRSVRYRRRDLVAFVEAHLRRSTSQPSVEGVR